MCNAAGTDSGLHYSPYLRVFLRPRPMLACRQRDSPDIVIHQVVVGEVVQEKLMSIAVVRWDTWWLTREQRCDTVSIYAGRVLLGSPGRRLGGW